MVVVLVILFEEANVRVPAPLFVKAPDPARLLAMEASPVLVAEKEVPVIVPLPVIDPLPRLTAPTRTL